VSRALEIQPGGFAPVPGTYEEVDVLGKPTGNRVAVHEGEQLPRSPRGFGWRLIAAS
jgi:hypothetical protein